MFSEKEALKRLDDLVFNGESKNDSTVSFWEVKKLINEIYKEEKYDPFESGRELYQKGLGISDIWGAVKQDEDMDECLRGYNFEKDRK